MAREGAAPVDLAAIRRLYLRHAQVLLLSGDFPLRLPLGSPFRCRAPPECRHGRRMRDAVGRHCRLQLRQRSGGESKEVGLRPGLKVDTAKGDTQVGRRVRGSDIRYIRTHQMRERASRAVSALYLIEFDPPVRASGVRALRW